MKKNIVTQKEERISFTSLTYICSLKRFTKIRRRDAKVPHCKNLIFIKFWQKIYYNIYYNIVFERLTKSCTICTPHTTLYFVQQNFCSADSSMLMQISLQLCYTGQCLKKIVAACMVHGHNNFEHCPKCCSDLCNLSCGRKKCEECLL